MEDLRKYSYCSVNLCLAAVEAAVFALCLLTGDRLYAAGRCGTYLVLRDGQKVTVPLSGGFALTKTISSDGGRFTIRVISQG